jgi:Tfp pilus assembly protein FimT
MRRRSPARSHPFSGFTYIEFIVTAAIVAVLFGIVPPLIMNSARFLNISMARLELQRDSRDVSEAILARLRQAVTTTVVVRAKPGQPPCTWIQFQTRSGSTVDFWQQGNELWGSDSVHSPSGRRFTRNLRYVAFTYYDTMDDSSMGVNLCFQKQVMRMFGDNRIYHVVSERVRILNDA